jgi:hypothetical protein
MMEVGQPSLVVNCTLIYGEKERVKGTRECSVWASVFDIREAKRQARRVERNRNGFAYVKQIAQRGQATCQAFLAVA